MSRAWSMRTRCEGRIYEIPICHKKMKLEKLSIGARDTPRYASSHHRQTLPASARTENEYIHFAQFFFLRFCITIIA